MLGEFGVGGDWIVLQPVEDVKYQEFLETQVDSGEASVIALGKDDEAD